jgi:hypothetical protein
VAVTGKVSTELMALLKMYVVTGKQFELSEVSNQIQGGRYCQGCKAISVWRRKRKEYARATVPP